jgi:hypothetical protein
MQFLECVLAGHQTVCLNEMKWNFNVRFKSSFLTLTWGTYKLLNFGLIFQEMCRQTIAMCFIWGSGSKTDEKTNLKKCVQKSLFEETTKRFPPTCTLVSRIAIDQISGFLYYMLHAEGLHTHTKNQSLISTGTRVICINVRNSRRRMNGFLTLSRILIKQISYFFMICGPLLHATQKSNQETCNR